MYEYLRLFTPTGDTGLAKWIPHGSFNLLLDTDNWPAPYAALSQARTLRTASKHLDTSNLAQLPVAPWY